jgi:hypothetical protein
MAAFNGEAVYPVGVLAAIQRIGRALTVRHDDLHGKRVAIVRRELRKEWRYLRHQIRARNWRAVRNNFNGYLAEHDNHPHNCGKGWTKRAAIRRADRLCAEALWEFDVTEDVRAWAEDPDAPEERP